MNQLTYLRYLVSHTVPVAFSVVQFRISRYLPTYLDNENIVDILCILPKKRVFVNRVMNIVLVKLVSVKVRQKQNNVFSFPKRTETLKIHRNLS